MADQTVGWAPGSSDPKVAFAEFKLHLKTITPHLRVVPVVVGLNLLVYAAMVATGVSPMTPTAGTAIRWGADFGPLTQGGQPWRLLSNLFVHFGAIHLFANMIALASAGPTVERLFGTAAFAALYLVAGIAGSVASLAVHPLIVSAGASGAIFGVYGALGASVLLHREAIPSAVLSKLGGVAGSFIVYNIVYGFGHAGIDNTAHLGGLLGGALAGALLFRPLVEGRREALRRPALLTVATCVLALGAAHALPHPLSLTQIANDYIDDDHAAVSSYEKLLKRMNAGDNDPIDAANTIENGILPGWRRTRAKLEARAREWSSDQPPTSAPVRLLDLYQELAAAREDGWTRMTTALRASDKVKLWTITREFNQRTGEIIAHINDVYAETSSGAG